MGARLLPCEPARGRRDCCPTVEGDGRDADFADGRLDPDLLQILSSGRQGHTHCPISDGADRCNRIAGDRSEMWARVPGSAAFFLIGPAMPAGPSYR